ncbi:MAG: nucleotidyltransferase family protein, partial [Alphaproteobacteria bacterium]
MSIAIPKTAMVLAAGLGRRMLPLTENTPKPLIEVGGVPLINHVLDRLAGQGVERAVVNVHHIADQMRAHLANYQGLEVIISDETDGLLDSGGGILKALPLLGQGPWLVVNSDLILLEDDPSIPRLADFFDEAQMDFLMLLAPTLETTGFEGPGDFHCAANGVLSWRAPCEKA